ncbi:unnamed protein product, partial [Clonostachys byssicola]
MHDQLTLIWNKAQARHLAHLSNGDLWAERVSRVNSPQSLAAHIRQLESNRSHSQAFGWAFKLITQLESFSSIISLFTQGNPGISALLWTPLAIIIELASREQLMLEFIGHTFSQFEQALPQFEGYLKEFGSRVLPQGLQNSLIVFYAEFIGHYQDAIKFLEGKKRLLFLFPRPQRFSRIAKQRSLNLLNLKKSIDDEINLFKFQIYQEHHRELKECLEGYKDPTMAFEFSCTGIQHRKNPHFHFREEVFEELHTHLMSGRPRNEHRAAGLHGIGGVGKTQVALEFAHRYSNEYDAIFWINAETEAKLTESLYSYARMVENESPVVAEQKLAAIKNFRRFLNNPPSKGSPFRWLAIYDNVEDVRLFEKFWLEGPHGSLILTTRSPEIAHASGGRVIPIPLFTVDESLAFMLKMNTNSDALDKEELDVAREIADRTGHLPLALNSISAYARTTSSSYRTFIQHYRDFDTNMLFQDDKGRDSTYERSIRNTWTMTLNLIDPLAQMLMETVALLDPDGIPTELFECHDLNAKFEHNGPARTFPRLSDCLSDRFPNRLTSFDNAVSALSGKGLISKSSGSERLSCHRMIKEAVLQSLKQDDLELHFDWIVFSLNACFPHTDCKEMLETWDKCAMFHSQISMLLKMYKRFSNTLRPPILLCEIVRRCAWYLRETGYFQAAKEILMDGFDILEQAVERRNHPGYFPQYMSRITAELYSTYGSLEYEENLPGYGRAWFQKAEQHRMKLIEAEAPKFFDIQSMALVDGDISLTYLADGLPDPSVGTYNMLLDTFDSQHHRCIWAANLSIALRAKGNLDESLSWCRKSSEWVTERHGERSLEMAIVHFNTACTLLLMNRGDEAMAALENSLRIRQEKSPMHRYLGFTQHKIGEVMKSREDFERAELFFRTAAKVLEKCESCEGATARSKYSLLTILKDKDSHEADRLGGEISMILQGFMDTVDRNVWSEDYFDKFVLYCHR